MNVDYGWKRNAGLFCLFKNNWALQIFITRKLWIWGIKN